MPRPDVMRRERWARDQSSSLFKGLWTPPASTAPWKTGKRTPVSHSANRPLLHRSNLDGNETAACFGERISLRKASHTMGPQGGMLLNSRGPMPLKSDNCPRVSKLKDH